MSIKHKRVLLLGSDGFLGRIVADALESGGHIVLRSTYSGDTNIELRIDLSGTDDLKRVLKKFRPEVIINCAGIVQNTELAKLNVLFSDNIFSAIREAGVEVSYILTTGSAAEYGEVAAIEKPISESQPIRPVTVYGEAKAKETQRVLEQGAQQGIKTAVIRLFNPIGSGMNERMLIPSLLRQILSIKTSITSNIQVTNLAALRDYVDVRDVARAYKMLMEAEAEGVYNVGSGVATSNKEIVRLLLEAEGLDRGVEVVETSALASPEKIASRADITHIQEVVGWKPQYTLQETMEEVVAYENRQ